MSLSNTLRGNALGVLRILADAGFRLIGWLPWSFLIVFGQLSIERQIRNAIRSEGTSDKVLAVLQRGVFHNIKIARRNVFVLATVCLTCAIASILLIVGLCVCYFLLKFALPSWIHEYAAYLYFVAFSAFPFGACLFPVLAALETRNRLISDFTEGLLWFRDGHPVVASNPYAVYLRSFGGELAPFTPVGPHPDLGEGGLALWDTRMVSAGMLIKESIASLHPDFVIVEALNLEEEQESTRVDYGANFKKICLYQFYDWERKVHSLCEHAGLVFFHLDNASLGVRTELRIIKGFSTKTIVFYNGSLSDLMPNDNWLAAVNYDSLVYPSLQGKLQATVTTRLGVKEIKFDAQWLRDFLSASPECERLSLITN